MEQILPALEGQLRRFRRHAGWLSRAHPQLASRLGSLVGAPDAHVDRLVQGVAVLHARSALALRRARWQQDEHLLELHFPGQLRPFPGCRIAPASGRDRVVCVEILAARYCRGPEAAIELDLLLGPEPAPIEVYIDGDAPFSAALRNALLAGADGAAFAAARPIGGGEWRRVPRWPFAPTGLDPDEALLPRPPGAHAGLALLRELLTFPARFNVLRLDLPPFAQGGSWTLSLPAPDLGAQAADLLEALQANHLRPGWSASAGLQRAAAAPIRIDGRQDEYLLSVPPELEIFSIDRVRVNGAAHPAWTARRVAKAPPGHEWRIAFEGAGPATASIDVTCCQRSAVLARPALGAGVRWQLNSLLALEQSIWSAATLREVMATQAASLSPASLAIISAVRGLESRAAMLRIGRAVPLLGTELCLQIDETALAGCGLHLFVQVMDRFFAECAHLNTFTRLVLVSARSGEELTRCKAKNAGLVLE